MTPTESAARHRAIAADYAAGLSSAALAAKYGCTKSVIHYAVKTYGQPRPAGRTPKAGPVPPPRQTANPKCCGRPMTPIVHPVSEAVLRHQCWKCWKEHE